MAGTVYVDNIITDTGTTVNVSNVQFTTSGQIRSVAGSASTPGISVQNNTNTGIFFPAANTIAFAEGGVESLRITNEGTLSTNTAGVAGIQLYQDTNDPTASSRLFFTSNTASSVLLQSAANLAFFTGATLGSSSGTRRIDFNAFGITLGGSGAASSGMGIKFPASQSASSDPNSLDDYEEGTFTATLSPGTSGSITLNSTFDLLSYTKIGRLVTITGQLVVSSVSSPVGSLVNLNNLPFPCADTSELSERAGGCTTYIDDSANLFYTQGMLLAASDTFTRIYMSESGRVAAIAANDAFVFSFSYITST